MKNNASTRSRGLFHKDNMQDTILLCLFIAIILVLAFTPLGMIQLPLIKATILHVPVIIGSVLFGPKKGGVLGFLFGLCSFVSNTFTLTALSFAFSPLIPAPGTDSGSWWALVVCFIPGFWLAFCPGLCSSCSAFPLKRKTISCAPSSWSLPERWVLLSIPLLLWV